MNDELGVCIFNFEDDCFKWALITIPIKAGKRTTESSMNTSSKEVQVDRPICFNDVPKNFYFKTILNKIKYDVWVTKGKSNWISTLVTIKGIERPTDDWSSSSNKPASQSLKKGQMEIYWDSKILTTMRVEWSEVSGNKNTKYHFHRTHVC